MKDQEILLRFKKEETRDIAFRELITEHQQYLYWHLRRMLISHEDAEDALQETFLSAYRYIEGFKGESQLSTWLYTIATRHALKILKRRNLLLISERQVQQKLCSMLEHALLPDSDEAEKKLHYAIIKLPEKQRLIFNLRYFDALSYEEISRISGISVSSAKTNYHYAHTKIKNYLKDKVSFEI